MKEIVWKSEDDSLEIKLQFINKNKLKYTHLGKSWPKHTQCLMYFNGLLKCFETIIKHERDKDNPLFAHRLVAERCMRNINNKWVRGEVRKELNRFLEIL